MLRILELSREGRNLQRAAVLSVLILRPLQEPTEGERAPIMIGCLVASSSIQMCPLKDPMEKMCINHSQLEGIKEEETTRRVSKKIK